MSCDAPASGAVSGLLTLLMVTVDHEFFLTARSGQTLADSTESAMQRLLRVETPFRPCIYSR
jgi:hypothetical protein